METKKNSIPCDFGKIEIEFNESLLHQKITLPNMQQAIYDQTANLANQQVRNALKELGWLPPEEAVPLQYKFNKLKDYFIENDTFCPCAGEDCPSASQNCRQHKTVFINKIISKGE